MVELRAERPFGDREAVEIGSARLEPRWPGQVTAVAAFHGRTEALSARLEKVLEAPLPAPGRWAPAGRGLVLWSGRNEWFIVGDVALPGDLGDLAAVTDRTHAFAVTALHGDGAADVLARLVPIDLHPALFTTRHVARVPVGHLPGCLLRRAEDGFELWGWRSAAGTLWHDLTEAMARVAGRAALAEVSGLPGQGPG